MFCVLILNYKNIKHLERNTYIMKILFIGDVVGETGIEILRRKLPKIKKEHNVDFTIANAENAHASGVGLNFDVAQTLFSLGIDVLTGGNHSLRRCDMSLYEDNEFILCPQNFLVSSEENTGVVTFSKGKDEVSVVNLIGTAFLDANRNPFYEMKSILKRIDSKYIIVDFHAESTAEKQAFAHQFDGKVTAVVGTHTHVQTNDNKVLEKGTMYITDAGSVAAENSVLGIEKEAAIKKQHFLTPTQFKVAKGEGFVHGVVIDCEKNEILIIKV